MPTGTMDDVRKSFRHFGRRGKGYTVTESLLLRSMKFIHVTAASAWAGGVLVIAGLSCLAHTAENPQLAAHARLILHLVDGYLVMPGLFGCIVTGFLYSSLTSIGFVRVFWVGAKWLMSLCAAFWGMIFLESWGDQLLLAAGPTGFFHWLLSSVRAVLLPENPLHGTLQVLFVLSMLALSVFRPVHIRLPRPLESSEKAGVPGGSGRKQARAVPDAEERKRGAPGG